MYFVAAEVLGRVCGWIHICVHSYIASTLGIYNAESLVIPQVFPNKDLSTCYEWLTPQKHLCMFLKASA